nr:MAG TPA: hypothetical protein [Caudoviricetes sp.]
MQLHYTESKLYKLHRTIVDEHMTNCAERRKHSREERCAILTKEGI